MSSVRLIHKTGSHSKTRTESPPTMRQNADRVRTPRLEREPNQSHTSCVEFISGVLLIITSFICEMHERSHPRPGATGLRLVLNVCGPLQGPRHLTSLAHLRCREPAVAGHKLRQQACAGSTTLAGSSCGTLDGAPTPECAHESELCVAEAAALLACRLHASADASTASPKIPTGGRTSRWRVHAARSWPGVCLLHTNLGSACVCVACMLCSAVGAARLMMALRVWLVPLS